MTVTAEAAIAAITTSRVEASLALGTTSIGNLEASPNLCWSISGIPMASFNAVVRYRPGPDPDREIDAVLGHFASRAMPLTWWVEGAQQDLERRLRDHGFIYYGEESPGMAIVLTSAASLGETPRSVSVQRVTDPTRADLRVRARAVMGGVGIESAEL